MIKQLPQQEVRSTLLPMKVLDLFSGIGGFSLGLERTDGFQTVAFCENDPFCRRVLARHWPNVEIHNDVKQLNGKDYAGSIDVICGGYPCQGFSVAGSQLGHDDPRYLWPEMYRIICEGRPRWVICENVTGHVNLGFDTVASQMEEAGFAVWPFLIPASAVGSPHNRERLWIVGNAEHHGHAAPAVAGSRAQAEERNQEGESQAGEPAGASQPMDGRAVGDWTDSVLAFPDWAHESPFRGMADGLPDELDKSRIRALGNTLLPQIPQLIGRTIIKYEALVRVAA